MPVYLNNDKKALKFTQYPAGERGVEVLIPPISTESSISCLFNSNLDLVDVLLVYNALKNINPKIRVFLEIPYLPSAREDRLEQNKSFGLQVVAQILNSCDFEEIVVCDSHSNVAAALFPPGKFRCTEQCYLLDDEIRWLIAGKEKTDYCFLAPDLGASKKIEKLSIGLDLPLFFASKTRNSDTGKLSNTQVPQEVSDFKEIIVVDDICDGGRTFLNLAEQIKKINPTCNLHLFVTHGIFSAGREKLKTEFKTVFAYHNIDMW